LIGHKKLLLVRRAGSLPAAAQATVRVRRPACLAPISLAHGVRAPRDNRSDARPGVAGCRPPLPSAGQGELALQPSPWPDNLQEPTTMLVTNPAAQASRQAWSRLI
jgi:hypothetical protein